MNTMSDFDRHAAAWLAAGPTELSDRVLDAALREVHLTRQRPRWAMPWRVNVMSLPMRLAAIAIVAVAGTAALTLFYRGFGIGTPPTAKPTATGTPSPSVPPSLLDTTKWTPFTSRYSFSAAYPVGWTAAPASEDWSFETAYEMSSKVVVPGVYRFSDTRTGLVLTAFRTVLGQGDGPSTTPITPIVIPYGSWIDAYEAGWPGEGTPSACTATAAEMTKIKVDGNSALLTTKCPSQPATAFVGLGDRMFVFSISDRSEVELLNAFLSTVTLPWTCESHGCTVVPIGSVPPG